MQHAALLCCGVPVHGIALSQAYVGFVLAPSQVSEEIMLCLPLRCLALCRAGDATS